MQKKRDSQYLFHFFVRFAIQASQNCIFFGVDPKKHFFKILFIYLFIFLSKFRFFGYRKKCILLFTAVIHHRSVYTLLQVLFID